MRSIIRFALLTLALSTAAKPAEAASLLINGSFEAGLTGWTVVNQAGGSGNWYSQTGLGSPLNGFAVPAPPDGLFAAMTDQGGPGSHVLYQDFLVPTDITDATLSFQWFVNNTAAAFSSPASLSYTVVPNQQARVDITTAGGDPFSLATVLLNVFQATADGGYAVSSTDLTAFLQAYGGQTLRLRFAEVDNQLFFNFGVDAVSLQVETVPEPATLTMLGVGLAAVAARRRRRNKIAA